MVDFIFVVIELFFCYLLQLRRYERKSVEVGVFRRESVTLSADFRGKGASPTNHYWYQSSRVIALSCGIKISAVHHLVLSQCTRLTDGQTDGQNYDSQDCPRICSRGKIEKIALWVTLLGHLGVAYALHLWLAGKPVVDFMFVVIELFSLSPTVETLWAEIGRSRRFSKGVGHFERRFQREGASPTNHCWCQSSRVITLSCGNKIYAVRHLVLSQSTRVTEGRTDGQNYDSQDCRRICSRGKNKLTPMNSK